MNLILIIGVITGIAFIGGIIFLIILARRGSSKINFLIANRELTQFTPVKAKMEKDENGLNVFQLPESSKPLPARPPNFYLGGKPYRIVSWGKDGEYYYIDKLKLTENKFLEMNLSPEEKQIALNRHRLNSKRYNKQQTDKWQAIIAIGLMVIALLIAVGNGYAIYQQGKITNTLVSSTKDIAKLAGTNSQTVKVMQQTTESLTAVAYSLTHDEELNRRIEGS